MKYEIVVFTCREDGSRHLECDSFGDLDGENLRNMAQEMESAIDVNVSLLGDRLAEIVEDEEG